MIKRLAVFVILCFSSTMLMAQERTFQEGVHYIKLDTPVRTADSSRIEVVELFWYGCPGCYVFEPLMANWEAKQPADVDHKRLPVIWDPITKLHAQAFYAAESLGALDKIHQPFFDAFHQRRNRLQSEALLRDFFESNGIPNEDFNRAFGSFGVRTRLNQTEARMREYGRLQTPSIYVNGKFLVMSGDDGYQQMLDVVDYLIALERGT